LDQNADKLQATIIDGVEPTFDNIASGDYPVSRSLYFYVKNAHVGTIPGIQEYVTAFTSENAWGPDGYLPSKGLIPLPDDMRATVAKSSQALEPMSSPK
jgi:phosphate transport system substrate-binding protein